MRAFFYSAFIFRNGQNAIKLHPFCSQTQNEQNVANAFCTSHSHSRIVNKKTRFKISTNIRNLNNKGKDKGTLCACYVLSLRTLDIPLSFPLIFTLLMLLLFLFYKCEPGFREGYWVISDLGI